VIFARYVTIQLFAYSIDIGLFMIVLHIGLSGPLFANVLAKLAAGIFAFLAHRSFTFRVGEKPAIRQQAQAFRYFLLLALNVPIASAVLALVLAWVTEPVAAKFIADIACVALTYGISKHFIFNKKQGCPERRHFTGADV
jgi:putative flippase GtrA